MADILLDALKPYMSAGAYKDLPYSTLGEFDRTQFSPDYSLGLMREYNKSYGLGLTDAQIAAGIKAFGDRHQAQFGVGISALSNPVAVAAESIERALASAGKDPGPFWAAASPYLAQGEDMAQRNWNNTSTATQTEQRAATSQGEDWFGDLVMNAAPLLMAGAVGGAFSPGGMFGGTAGATAAGEAASGGFIDALGGMTDLTGTALPGWSSGAAGAAGTGGTLADLAGGNMDFTDFWNYGDSATQFAPDNVVDLFNNAGMPGYSNYGQSLEQLAAELFNNAGTPGFDQLGNEATGLDWLKSQFGGPGSATSNITNTIKTLTGGGTGVTGAAAGSGSGENNLMRLLGSLGSAGLGAYASNQQTSQLDEMAKRYEGYGAPYRQKLSDLYTNPDSFLKSNEVQKPVQMGTDALMRSLSTKGNPFGSGNALQQGQSYASDQLFGKLGQEKDRLAGFGGLSSYNSAAPQTATNAIQSSSNGYNAIGAGLGNIFNPPKTEAQTMADFMKMMRG